MLKTISVKILFVLLMLGIFGGAQAIPSVAAQGANDVVVTVYRTSPLAFAFKANVWLWQCDNYPTTCNPDITKTMVLQSTNASGNATFNVPSGYYKVSWADTSYPCASNSAGNPGPCYAGPYSVTQGGTPLNLQVFFMPIRLAGQGQQCTDLRSRPNTLAPKTKLVEGFDPINLPYLPSFDENGFNTAFGTLTNFFSDGAPSVRTVGRTYKIDFGYNNIRYSDQIGTDILNTINSYSYVPGSTWILGEEPNTAGYYNEPGGTDQLDRQVADYVLDVHSAVQRILALDSAAQIFFGYLAEWSVDSSPMVHSPITFTQKFHDQWVSMNSSSGWCYTPPSHVEHQNYFDDTDPMNGHWVGTCFATPPYTDSQCVITPNITLEIKAVNQYVNLMLNSSATEWLGTTRFSTSSAWHCSQANAFDGIYPTQDTINTFAEKIQTQHFWAGPAWQVLGNFGGYKHQSNCRYETAPNIWTNYYPLEAADVLDSINGTLGPNAYGEKILNLIPNAGFEWGGGSFLGWSVPSRVNISTSQHKTGVASTRAYDSNPGGTDQFDLFSPLAGVSVGKSYDIKLACEITQKVGSPVAYFYAFWTDTNGNYLNATYVGGDANCPSSNWGTIPAATVTVPNCTIVGQCPVTGAVAYGQVLLRGIVSPGQTLEIYYDDISFQPHY